MIPFLAIAAVVRERPDALAEEQPPIGVVLRAAWANVPFRWVTVVYMLNWITFDLVGLMIPFLVTYHLCRADPTARTSILGPSLPVESAMLGALLIVAIPALPLWELATRRLGKRGAYSVAMAYWAVVMASIWLVPPGAIGLAIGVAALCGGGTAAAPEAMIPDVVDADELRTGKRNEGVYYGAKNLFRKAAGAIAVFSALQVLGWSGYTAPEGVGAVVSQPPAALLAIRLLTGPAGALLLLGATAAAYGYPISRARHEEIRAALTARRT